MTPQEVLTAAKSGNPQAIAALINRHLKPQGITAKAKLAAGCLHVMVEGVTVPEQRAIVPYIVKGVRGLEVQGVSSLAVYGKVAGDEIPAWSDRVELGEPDREKEDLKSKNTASAEVKPALTFIESAKTQLNKEPWTFNHWLGLASLIIVMMWLLHACTYPHNCEEATAALAEADSELDGYLKKAEDGKATMENIQGATYAKGLAEAKERDLCRKN